MNKQLKNEIVRWLLDNENRWRRADACIEEFSYYIFNANRNYLIGGDVIESFIRKADNLLYGGDFV